VAYINGDGREAKNQIMVRRETSMKRNFVWAVCFAMLLLGVAAVAPAQDRDGRSWSRARLAGEWGYTETGTVLLPTGVLINGAAVGKYTFDNKGNFTGTQYSSTSMTTNTDAVEDMKLGTYTMNSDGTGTLTLDVYDPTGTTLRRHSVWAIVLDDNGNEIRGIMVSMTLLPSGLKPTPIMTMTAIRMSPGRDD
jgi:hypothetical protein